MKYTINYYTDEDRMSEGFTVDVEAMSATQAALDAITMLADYDEGTKGYEDYLEIMKVSATTEDVNISAYRLDAQNWEVHMYVADQDEAFAFTPSR